MDEDLEMLVATSNRHKVEEIRWILGEKYRVWSMHDVRNPPRLIENESTFAGNATAKARQLAQYLTDNPDAFSPSGDQASYAVLADDSGLEVDSLGGAPGVHSARFANLEKAQEYNASDAENNSKLLRLLAELPEAARTARFRCVLALMEMKWPGDVSSGEVHIFEGRCEGRIAHEPRGHGGFGYDPLFIPEGEQRSFAELGEEIKNRLSHRYRALVQMRDWLVLRSERGIA